MNVRTAIEADAEAAILVQPGQGSFDRPAESAQAAAVRLAALGDDRGDAAGQQGQGPDFALVGAVGEQRPRSSFRSAGLARDWRYGVDQRDQLSDVVAIRAGEDRRERDAVAVGEDVVFRAGLAPIRGIRAGFFAPPTARIEALSTIARFQSIWSASFSRSSSTWCSRVQTPPTCHSASRFHRVMPQQPISCGKSSQPMPVLSTNRMPDKHIRSLLRGWPPLGLGVHGGKMGSMTDQSASSTSKRAMRSSLTRITASCSYISIGQQGRRSARFF